MGLFSVWGRKCWFLVCVNDYSWFIVCAEPFDYELAMAEIVVVLERQKRFPKAILSDHGPQFIEMERLVS
jgi:hypothetical protein